MQEHVRAVNLARGPAVFLYAAIPTDNRPSRHQPLLLDGMELQEQRSLLHMRDRQREQLWDYL